MPPETSKYISIFVVLTALLPNLLASDLPIGSPAFSPSYASFAPSSDVVPAPVTSDGGISAPPISSSISLSPELNEAPSSLESKRSDLSPYPAPGNVVTGAPSSIVSFPPNVEAPSPELAIANGGEDVSSLEPLYSAPPSYTEAPSNPNSKVLPFEYRAEDELVDPYTGEETHGGSNGAVAGVMVGVGVVGLAGFVYYKKKSNNVRAQYMSLGRNNIKKSVSL